MPIYILCEFDCWTMLCISLAHEVPSEKTKINKISTVTPQCSYLPHYWSTMHQAGSFDLRQLHAHEDSRHEEAEENADKSNEKQQEPVEFGNVWCIGAVQDYKAQASHCEEETGGQSFHNVLSIYSDQQKYLHQLHVFFCINSYRSPIWLTYLYAKKATGRWCPCSSVIEPTLGGSTITS